jgi:hypothetical protein
MIDLNSRDHLNMQNKNKYSDVFGDRVAPNGCYVRENFAEWFEGSQIFDEKGPITLFHGLRNNVFFDTFKPDKNGLVFFAEDAGFADDWIGDARNNGGSTMKVYVRAENVWDYQNPIHVEMLISGLKDVQNEPTPAWQKNLFMVGDWLQMEYLCPQLLEKMNFDAMWITEENNDRMGMRMRNLAVFETASIKSAIGNSGLFKRNNKSISDCMGNFSKPRYLPK